MRYEGIKASSKNTPTLGDVMIRIYAIGINSLLFVILTKIYLFGSQILIEPNKGFLLIEVLSTVFFMAWFSVNTYRWVLKNRRSQYAEVTQSVN